LERLLLPTSVKAAILLDGKVGIFILLGDFMEAHHTIYVILKVLKPVFATNKEVVKSRFVV